MDKRPKRIWINIPRNVWYKQRKQIDKILNDCNEALGRIDETIYMGEK